MDGSKAHCQEQTARINMGATVIRTSASEGDFVEVRACAIGFFCRCSPPGAMSAEGGVAVHRGERPVELPRLARPKGCFVTSAEWS